MRPRHQRIRKHGISTRPTILIKELRLHEAAGKGQVEEVRVLISAGIDKDCVWGESITTPLCKAASNGHAYVVQVLVESGADINKGGVTDGRTPLHFAAGSGYVNCAQLLINNGADTAVSYCTGRPSQLAQKSITKRTKSGVRGSAPLCNSFASSFTP